MTINAQKGVVGYAVQTAKVGASGTFDPDALTWYRFRAPRISVGTFQDQQVFPLEVGGTIVPTGSYKQQYFFAGEIDLIPRIENILGWLLKGTMGSASTVTGVDGDAQAVTGLNTHIFTFDPADIASQPWMAVRRLAPGAIPADNLGEIGFDCKINMLRIAAPQMGKLMATTQMVGRDVQLVENPTWTWDNAYEDSESTPDSGRGSVTIGGVEYPSMGLSVDIMNGLTSPQQEMIIGDFRPDDFIALTRRMTIRFVHKVNNYDLYQQLLTGQANGTTWSSLPFTEESDSGGYAFDARFEAPADVPGTTPATPYRLRIRANKVTWQVDGPPELNAGGFVTQAYTGTVLEPDSGNYAEIVLENAEASY